MQIIIDPGSKVTVKLTRGERSALERTSQVLMEIRKADQHAPELAGLARDCVAPLEGLLAKLPLPVENKEQL